MAKSKRKAKMALLRRMATFRARKHPKRQLLKKELTLPKAPLQVMTILKFRKLLLMKHPKSKIYLLMQMQNQKTERSSLKRTLQMKFISLRQSLFRTKSSMNSIFQSQQRPVKKNKRVVQVMIVVSKMNLCSWRLTNRLM